MVKRRAGGPEIAGAEPATPTIKKEVNLAEKLTQDPDLVETTPEINSAEFLRFQEMFDTGEGEINSKVLKETFERGEITRAELGELALTLLEKIEPKAEEASIDELTGLGNRRLFRESLDTAISRLRSGETSQHGATLQSLIVVALDMNFLHDLNNTYGHQAGDRGLIALADRLKESTELDDVIARVGGDEFLIILPIANTTENIHEDTFRGIREAIGGLTIDIENQEGKTIPFSIETATGYSVLDKTDTQTTTEQLIDQADQAMYQNKKELKEKMIN